MMNGLPNHQQPPMPSVGAGGPPRMPGLPMTNGPPMSNQTYGGAVGVASMPMMPKQNVVPVPGGGAPQSQSQPQPSMMPMMMNTTNKQLPQPPVPRSQLPPGNNFAPMPTSMNSQRQQPPPTMMSRPTAIQQSAPVPAPPPTLSLHQNGGFSANSSRTASPHPHPPPAATTPSTLNRIPTGQLPPGAMMNNTQTPNRMDLNATTLNANFTPLKASTPQYGSPVVPIQNVNQAQNPGQISAQALSQGVQNMNLNYVNGQQMQKQQIPPQQQQQQQLQQPQTTNGHGTSGGGVQAQPPMPPTGMTQQRPGQQLPPAMANRYPQPVTAQQQPPSPPQQQQFQPAPPPVPSGNYAAAGAANSGPGGVGIAQKYPPMPTTMNSQHQQNQQPPPPGMFGASPMGQQPQPLQYQSQMPPQPGQLHQYPQQGQGQQPGHQFQLHSNQFNANQNNNLNNNNMNNNTQRGNLSVTQSGFSKLWGQETVDLMQNRHILPPEPVQPPTIKLNNQFYESVNCSPDVFRCTLTKIPETKELLNKSRLPLGVLIHPFRDINKLPVIQCTEIVRCRACRTYINPFVYFVDSLKWKCNLCYRVNELPKEFQYDPITKTYGDVTRRPEVKSSTIEFIASSEYMLRPPPPAIYLFLLDVSSIAVQSGYLNVVCQTISNHLDELPGDARTQVAFVAYNSAVHFYNIAEGFNQPHEITVLDVDDVFLPCPDNLCVNLKECKELVKDLLVQLPKRFADAHDSKSALGAALQAAFKMIGSTGGRVTVFQTCLPNAGPGALVSREDPNNRSSKEVPHLGPATDYYKRLALECSGQQISVDLFILNSQYSDIATLAGVSKYSGGCMHHFPLFSHTKVQQVEALRASLERYLTRKIGFEAVMRIRCTRGLAIHTFHGNFFVRSTDLLSLPNVNPDAGFAMQIAHEESLTDLKTVCFQAALLYTSSKGERRIRVHTLCLPVVNQLSDLLYSADSQAIAGLLVKMAVDRSLTSTLADAREAFINATVDILSAFKLAQNLPPGQVVAPMNLALLPLYINAIMKHIAFRTGTSTRLDDRTFAMCEMKSLPLGALIRYIYPDFYNIDCLFVNLQQNGGAEKVNEEERPDPPRLQLSAEKLDSRSMFLMDTGPHMMIYIGTNASPQVVQRIFGVEHVAAIPDLCYTLQNNNSAESEALFAFIEYLNEDKPYPATIQVIRDSSSYRAQFTEKFVDDRTESALSYYEFLQHLRTQMK